MLMTVAASGGGRVVDPQPVVLHGEGRGGGDASRESLVAIGADDAEHRGSTVVVTVGIQ